MNSSGVSKRTLVIAFAGVAFSLVVQVVFGSPAGRLPESTALYISDFGEAAIVAAAAIIAFWMAAGLGKGSAVHRQWTLIAAGIASFAVGETIWAVLEAVMGQQPFPSAADVFYVLSYIFIGAGMISAAIAYYRLVQSPLTIVLAFVATAAVGMAAYLMVLGPAVADPELSAPARLLSVGYPLADLFLEFLPALCVLLLVSKLGAGRLAWPWWVASAGTICLAVTDSGFSWAQSAGADIAATWLGLGWMLGFVLLAVAASVASDVGRPIRR